MLTYSSFIQHTFTHIIHLPVFSFKKEEIDRENRSWWKSKWPYTVRVVRIVQGVIRRCKEPGWRSQWTTTYPWELEERTFNLTCSEGEWASGGIPHITLLVLSCLQCQMINDQNMQCQLPLATNYGLGFLREKKTKWRTAHLEGVTWPSSPPMLLQKQYPTTVPAGKALTCCSSLPACN